MAHRLVGPISKRLPPAVGVYVIAGAHADNRLQVEHNMAFLSKVLVCAFVGIPCVDTDVELFAESFVETAVVVMQPYHSLAISV